MKTLVSVVVLSLALMGCSVASKHLDDSTGTLKAERCVDYRGFLAAALALQRTAPTEERAARIELYRAFILANCPEV